MSDVDGDKGEVGFSTGFFARFDKWISPWIVGSCWNDFQ